jgi:hypothetical protein
MNRLQRAAVLTALADGLRQRGSWCGETHLQKATYFLQELFGVPLGFDFIFYKHGPFAFGLRDELTALQADGLMELRPQPEPFGPSLVPTPTSQAFRARYPVTLDHYGRAVGLVADTLGRKGVVELERLATALFVTREQPSAPTEARARRINQLKPHVSLNEARAAVEAVDRVIRETQQAAASGAGGGGGAKSVI